MSRWIKSSKKNALVEATSLFVSAKRDKDDTTKITGWRLMATLTTGRSIPMSLHDTEEQALKALEEISKKFEFIQA